MATKIVGLDAFLRETKEFVTQYWITEQNNRLVKYAKSKILLIGDKIMTYHSRNHMDRTGNLLDSLCWGLSYRGKLVDAGFYRNQRASELSYLHEWFHEPTEPVGGHVLAKNFIKQMGNLQYNGWRLFFAILAPYWGYWENGFNFKGGGSEKFLKFAVMTEFHDVVEADLKPAKVSFKSVIPKYSKESWEKLTKDRDNRSGKKGGYSVFSKYPRGQGKGKYIY